MDCVLKGKICTAAVRVRFVDGGKPKSGRRQILSFSTISAVRNFECLLDNPQTVSGDPELPGFVLDLEPVWQP